MFAIDEDALPESQPLFDPAAFQKVNPDLKIGAWRLPEHQLKELCIQATAIRKRLMEKAEEQRK